MNVKRNLSLFVLALLLNFLAGACKERQLASASDAALGLDATSANELDVAIKANGHYVLNTTGTDPYVFLNPLKRPVTDGAHVLTFEYRASAPLNHIQVFFAGPMSEQRSLKIKDVEPTSNWRTFSIDLGDQIEEFSWGRAGDVLRMDFGQRAGVDIEIRRMGLRKRNAEEHGLAMERAEFRRNDQQWNHNLITYLKQEYPDRVSSVEVTADQVRIEGVSTAGAGFLAEITPYDELTEMKAFQKGVPIENGAFSVGLERYVAYDGFSYDRALSKWVIVDRQAPQAGMRSHARHADHIVARHATQPAMLASRKGMGGFAHHRGFTSDLDELDITSATVNIAVTSMMHLSEHPHTFPYVYNGQTYHVDAEYVSQLDQTLLATASRDIVVAAIILVEEASKAVDPEMGELLEHAHFSGDGAFFTMPRLDRAASVHAYAAMLDFLANRYTRPDSRYGRIHKWILHNEIDIGFDWTNMGENRPMHVYLDAYHKSMRLCHAIARSYDAHAEVMASFTHSWAEADAAPGYAALDMIEALLAYSRVEGDFPWGLACHPYPQDIQEPRTWEDERAVHHMRTPLVTFKNLEVLDAWIKQHENKYNQSVKRTLWLSENGTNSPTYAEQDLLEQAAGFAYAWKQFIHLDGIDAMQWHNWIDSRHEFGLRIGLRRFPDDEVDPGGRKPVWYLYQAAGTDREDEVFAPYKSVIGIRSWDEVMKGVAP